LISFFHYLFIRSRHDGVKPVPGVGFGFAATVGAGADSFSSAFFANEFFTGLLDFSGLSSVLGFFLITFFFGFSSSSFSPSTADLSVEFV
jgi:hypothetical protein